MKLSNSKFQIPEFIKRNLVLGIFLFANVTSGQFSFVNSKKGFTDVLRSPSAASDLVSKISNGTIVYAFEEEIQGNWIGIDVKINENDLSGFVIKSDVVSISKMTPILYSYSNEHKTILKSNDIGIIITDIAFDPAKAELKYSTSAVPYLEQIDGHPVFGTDGEIPKRRYGFLDVTISGRKIEIPASALAGLYEPNLENTEAFYDEVNDILYISSMNSDGAGGYHILWVVEKRKYKTRHIFYGF